MRKRTTKTYPRAGQNIDTTLGVVEGLDHGDESRSRITFFVNTREVVVHFDHSLLIDSSHLIHHSFEPLERTLFASHPVEVGIRGDTNLTFLLPGRTVRGLLGTLCLPPSPTIRVVRDSVQVVMQTPGVVVLRNTPSIGPVPL